MRREGWINVRGHDIQYGAASASKQRYIIGPATMTKSTTLPDAAAETRNNWLYMGAGGIFLVALQFGNPQLVLPWMSSERGVSPVLIALFVPAVQVGQVFSLLMLIRNSIAVCTNSAARSMTSSKERILLRRPDLLLTDPLTDRCHRGRELFTVSRDSGLQGLQRFID